MNIKELENYIELGSWASVCVDIKELPHYAGYVRAIVFYRNNRVCIEFYALVFDVHGAFIDYCGEFVSLEEAVNSIENFTGKPIEDWTNHNKTGDFPIYVDKESSVNISEDAYKRLKKDAGGRKIDLPQNGNFKLNWNIHFESRKQYEKFLGDLDESESELYKQATLTYGTTA